MQKNYQNYTVSDQHATRAQSPAFALAARIKSEQGTRRAAEYLAAIEPFIAPAEKQHIAEELNLPIIEYIPPANNSAPTQSRQNGFDPMQLINLMGLLQGAGQQRQAPTDMNSPVMLMSMLNSLMNKEK